MKVLTKKVLKLIDVASKDKTREGLQCIHVTKEYTEATNALVVIRVYDKDPQKIIDFPSKGLPDDALDRELPDEGILLSKNACKIISASMKKSALPAIDETALLTYSKDSPAVYVTDLSSISTIGYTNEYEGAYPNIDAIMPKEDGEKTKVTLGVDQIFEVLKVLRALSVYGDDSFTIEITKGTEENPWPNVVFKAKINGQKVVCVASPRCNA